MSEPPISRQLMALIGVSIGAFLGVVWGSVLFTWSCFYPDDVPCTVWGWTFSVGLVGLAGFVLCGIPMAVLALTVGFEIWEIIQRQDPILRAIGWCAVGIFWTATNAIMLAPLLSFTIGLLPTRAATLIVALLGATSMILWLSPRRLAARAFASGVLVAGLILARLSGLF